MNKLIVVALVGLLLMGSVSAYYCIYEEDNNAVKEFKYRINVIALENDLSNGLTPEAIYLKLKYFSPCKK